MRKQGLNPLAVGVSIQLINYVYANMIDGLNPLAVGVSIQLGQDTPRSISCQSQSPRGRGKYSTGQWEKLILALPVSIPSRSG